MDFFVERGACFVEKPSDTYLFAEMPVPRAVATLAVPTIISQVVTMIYNLADTFFIGQLGDPAMVAAVSLVSPWFNLLTALGNLFGLGGSSLISRMMGAQNRGEIKFVSAFSIWGGARRRCCSPWGPILRAGRCWGSSARARIPMLTRRTTCSGSWCWAACPRWRALPWATCCAARATPGRPARA